MRAIVTGGSRGIGAAIAAELSAKGHHVFAPSRMSGFDLATPLGRKNAMEEEPYPDIMVHNVGGGGRYGTNAEVFGKNVDCMIEFTQWALNGMLQKEWGRVITISSIHGREYGSRPVFMAAKAAQIAYMKGCSRNPDYVRRGITFNTVCPGNVSVDGKPDVDATALPMGRLGKPEEVAKLVAFLCSEAAAWINGSTITIDGGESWAI